MKMAVSQETTTTKSGNERELSSDPRNISQLVCRKLTDAAITAALIATWMSFCGTKLCNCS